MIPEEQWATLPDEAVRSLATADGWRIEYEARERKEGAHWYPTVNPEAARRTGHFVNSIGRWRQEMEDGKVLALSLRDETDRGLGQLILITTHRAEHEQWERQTGKGK